MSEQPIWITEADVVSLIGLPEAIDALERVLAMESRNEAENMPKTHLMVGANNAMHALGASVAGAGLCGMKTWVNVAGKSSTTLVLFSLEDGSCQALIEATALGQMRTAAMTGVGTKWLAPKGAADMAIIGTGKQSLTQIAACAAVRPLKSVRVSSRNPETRAKFVEVVQSQFDFKVTSAANLEDAVTDASIVTLITNSTETFFTAEMAATGSHINAMGAIVPARKEFTDDVFARCGVVAVDSLRGVQDLSAEFRTHYGDDKAAWEEVRTISSVVVEAGGRPKECDLTLFKAMGMGISDLALAVEILERARGQNKGHPLPERVRTPPRLTG